jgi:hypothetical protein
MLAISRVNCSISHRSFDLIAEGFFQAQEYQKLAAFCLPVNPFLLALPYSITSIPLPAGYDD